MHNYTPQSAGLLWTRDKPDAETSTGQRKTQQTNIPASGGIRSHNLSRRVTAVVRLRPRVHWDQHLLHLTVYCSVRYTYSTPKNCQQSFLQETKSFCTVSVLPDGGPIACRRLWYYNIVRYKIQLSAFLVLNYSNFLCCLTCYL